MGELVRLPEQSSRAAIEKGRVLLAAGEQNVREAGLDDVKSLHRHGGVMETILEREALARLVVVGRRRTDHEYATDHIGSMIERVVRASTKPVMIVPRNYVEPSHVVFAMMPVRRPNAHGNGLCARTPGHHGV